MTDPHRWLHQQLRFLVDDGIVSAEQAQILRERYAIREEKTRHTAILTGVGVCLVGVGAVVLFGLTWDTFSRPLRTVFALGPVALALAYDAWAWRRSGSGTVAHESQRTSRAARSSLHSEAAAVGLFFGTIASALLLRSTWDIRHPEVVGVFLCCALALALAWVRFSSALLAAFPLLVLVLAVTDSPPSMGPATIAAAVLLACASPAIVAGTRGGLANRWVTACFAGTTLVLSLKAALEAQRSPVLATASWIVGAHAAGALVFAPGSPAQQTLSGFVYAAGLALILALGFPQPWSLSAVGISQVFSDSAEGLALALTLGIPWVMIGLAYAQRRPTDNAVIAVSLLATVGTLATYTGTSVDVLRIAAVLVAALWGADRLRDGVRNGVLRELNFGLVLVLGLVLLHVARTSVEPLVMGGSLIGAGVAFLLVNRSVSGRHSP